MKRISVKTRLILLVHFISMLGENNICYQFYIIIFIIIVAMNNFQSLSFSSVIISWGEPCVFKLFIYKC